MRLVSLHRRSSSMAESEEASACSPRGNVTRYISEGSVGSVKLVPHGRSSRNWVGKKNMSMLVVKVDTSVAVLAWCRWRKDPRVGTIRVTVDLESKYLKPSKHEMIVFALNSRSTQTCFCWMGKAMPARRELALERVRWMPPSSPSLPIYASASYDSCAKNCQHTCH